MFGCFKHVLFIAQLLEINVYSDLMMSDGMKRPCVRGRVQSPASMLGVPLLPCEIICFLFIVETCPLIRQELQDETKIQVPQDFPIASAKRAANSMYKYLS